MSSNVLRMPIDPAWRPHPSDRAVVVFVHGAVVNGWEMTPMRHNFKRLGYRVRQFEYQSMLKGLDENILRLRDFLRETEGDILHLVGHSMGGVLIRRVFEEHPDPRPGRLVAIGSPFLDCWVGHRVKALHNYLLGKTVHDHITHPRDPVWRGARDFGVLAGTYPFGIGRLFPGLPSPSDGVVLWDETRLGNLTGHVTYRLNHFGMLFSTRCCMQTARFLATGKFAQVPTQIPIPVPR